MKRLLLYVLMVNIGAAGLHAQITTPVIKANFGVEADLRANFFNGFVQNGNDDWFRNTPGTGVFVIDTTGAAYILNQYTISPATRMQPFFRGMRYEPFSVINNSLLLDGIFIRDHHGDDSTVFASGSNKNGQNPNTWTTPISQGIPDKNDILDMFMHVRRAGPSLTDSMWMFGAVSIENTTGNRYFDFEMYQTDIYYDKPSLRFYGYGPDAGHTSWKFDAAGNVTQPGDIIFTAEYSSSSLSMLEARIWVHSSALLTTPAAFNWGGQFDGDGTGATYGYANILPKTAGAFYTGLQCGNNTWAGPFAVVRQDNTISSVYNARQLMEFSVNLSKLGLDPLVTSNDPCGLPFRRILVKSRASTSFTAELKDFVGPFSLFRAPRVAALADIPIFCGMPGVSNIQVSNAISTSIYTWRTVGGNIVGDTVGPSITVDQPGMYIVSQQLMDSCGFTYAMDTVLVTLDPGCTVLSTSIKDFRAQLKNNSVLLGWTVTNNAATAYYEIERSLNNRDFAAVGKVDNTGGPSDLGSFSYVDPWDSYTGATIFYRLKLTDINGNVRYSKTIGVGSQASGRVGLSVFPNPVRKNAQLVVNVKEADANGQLMIYNQAGILVRNQKIQLAAGASFVSLDNLEGWAAGVYFIKLKTQQSVYEEKMLYLK